MSSRAISALIPRRLIVLGAAEHILRSMENARNVRQACHSSTAAASRPKLLGAFRRPAQGPALTAPSGLLSSGAGASRQSRAARSTKLLGSARSARKSTVNMLVSASLRISSWRSACHPLPELETSAQSSAAKSPTSSGALSATQDIISCPRGAAKNRD